MQLKFVITLKATRRKTLTEQIMQELGLQNSDHS